MHQDILFGIKTHAAFLFCIFCCPGTLLVAQEENDKSLKTKMSWLCNVKKTGRSFSCKKKNFYELRSVVHEIISPIAFLILTLAFREAAVLMFFTL